MEGVTIGHIKIVISYKYHMKICVILCVRSVGKLRDSNSELRCHLNDQFQEIRKKIVLNWEIETWNDEKLAILRNAFNLEKQTKLSAIAVHI